jgi:uncharacterized membrane protein YkoI
MKRSLYFVFLFAAVCSFAVSPMSVAGPREDKKPAEPKITRSQAERVARFKYPGAAVEKCELIKGKDHPNWLVEVRQADARNVTQVQVDGVTGKILP